MAPPSNFTRHDMPRPSLSANALGRCAEVGWPSAEGLDRVMSPQRKRRVLRRAPIDDLLCVGCPPTTVQRLLMGRVARTDASAWRAQSWRGLLRADI